METNAWCVAGLLVERIDHAPVLGERIKVCLSEKKEDHLYLLHFIQLQHNKLNIVTDAAYFDKIVRFYDKHRSGAVYGVPQVL